MINKGCKVRELQVFGVSCSLLGNSPRELVGSKESGVGSRESGVGGAGQGKRIKIRIFLI